MAKIDISESQAKTHTEAYNAISKKLGGSDIKWRYEWCQVIQSTNIEDIISGKANEVAFNERNRDIETRLKDVEKNIHCGLYGTKGRKRHSVSLDKVPVEVMNVYRKSYEQDEIEEKRIASLTEEERQKEVQDILRQLSGMGGFMTIHMTGK